VDVDTDREVWMLYSSFMRALGPGLIWAYGPQAAAIAVGTTGRRTRHPRFAADAVAQLGGTGPGSAPGPAFLRSDTDPQPGRMRLARLHALAPVPGLARHPAAWDGARAAAALRGSLRATLWASAHPRPVLGITAAAAWLIWRWRRT
jgi:hypothetical protein